MKVKYIHKSKIVLFGRRLKSKKEGGMLVERVEVFKLDGLDVSVKFTFDEMSNMYIADFSDFEENQVYSPNGHPIVTAAQDSCEYSKTDGKFADCGSCRFFKTEGKNDLIGFCTNKALCKKN